MSDTYLIPQFIIDYLQKSRSVKNPKKIEASLLSKNKTPEIERWFKTKDVNSRYIWKFFVSQGKSKFYYKTCEMCGKRIKLNTLLHHPDAKYCSRACHFKSAEFKEKREKTWLTKYGVYHPSQSKEIQGKTKQTCLEKYGVEHTSQVKEVREKAKQTSRSNHWETFCSILKEKNIVPLFSKEEYINNTGRKFRCLVCEEEFESEGTFTYLKRDKNKDGSLRILIPYAIFCPNCHKAPISKKEKEVLEFVKSVYDGKIVENDRIKLEGKELDIFLPALNVAIEFDGNYWHSLEGAKERDEKKNQLCEEKRIRLIRIKEEDWDNRREEVKEILKESLKPRKRK